VKAEAWLKNSLPSDTDKLVPTAGDHMGGLTGLVGHKRALPPPLGKRLISPSGCPMPPVKVFDNARRRLSEANSPKVGSELIKSCIILREENANGIAENAGVPEISSIRSAASSLFPSGRRENRLKVPRWGPDKPHGSWPSGQSLKWPAGPDPAALCQKQRG